MIPTSLSVLHLVWPGDGPPALEEVRRRLGAAELLREVAAPEVSPPLWGGSWRTPEGDEHALALESLEPRRFGLVLEMSGLSHRERKEVRRARWVLQLATRLDPRAPLAAFGRQVRFALAACPEPVAIEDANAIRFLPVSRAKAIASWRTAPPPTDLYQGQAIFSPSDGRRRWWFHTHGLQRTGIPDVEILRLPHDLVSVAANLIREFVRAQVGRAVPRSGRAEDLFPGHAIEWIPALEAAASLDPKLPGSLSERGGALGHDDDRIALVEPGRPEGGRWRPPLDLLRAFERGEAVVRLPEQESERTARLARERWDVFAGLFAKHGRDRSWAFVVCLPHPVPEGGTEYLWWSVEGISGDGDGASAGDGVPADRVRARLETPPLRGDLPRGHVETLAVSELADWAVHAPDCSVDPSSVRIPA